MSQADDFVDVESTTSWRGPVAGGLLALLILWVLALASCTPSIESDLTDRSEAALSGAGLSDVSVDFDGRDAVLSGAVGAADAAEARRLVRSLTGVRHVEWSADASFDAAGSSDESSTTSTIKATATTTAAKATTTTAPPATSTPTTTTPATPTTTIPATTTTEVPVPPTTVAAAEVQQDVNALLAGRVVEFDSGSAALTAKGAAVLDELAPLLASAGSARVQVVGHTDTSGNPVANQRLSEARAETVRGALIARGIGAERLSTIGYGGDRPLAAPGTPGANQRNRRIEFVVSG